MKTRLRVITLLLLWLLVLAPSCLNAAEVSQADLENRRCQNCHSQSHIGQLSPRERAAMVAPSATANPPATRPGLYVPQNALAASVHAKLACTSCHAEAKTLPHPADLKTPTCDNAGCHVKENANVIQGAHAAAAAKGNKNAPTCVTCHGGHDILKKSERNSKTFPLNAVKVCGDCHQQHQTPSPGQGEATKGNVGAYLDSVHGRAVTKAGLPMAATCADCHNAHDVRPAKDPQSPVNRQHVPDTCGKCHVGVQEMYAGSVHGQNLAAGKKDAPVCSDCHTSHAITRADSPHFMKDIVAECGTCHDKPMPGSREKASLYQTYRASYHGQVQRLGLDRAARCSSCHGAHDIQRIHAANSRLNDANKVKTCQTCHPGADAKFASFAPHADFRNSDRYPILHYVYLYFVIMMSASFGFFGLHCVFWAVRSFIERLKHGPHPKIVYEKGKAIQRFNRVDRINHALVIISFFGLTLTGLPLLYSDKGWAAAMMKFFGGVQAAGLLHRMFAIMLIINFIIHGVGVFRRFRKYGVKQMLFGPTTMLPRVKDLKDLLGMFRWFYAGGPKPKFDRWTYWEKFDYMAEVGGSGIIGLSGLLLWFPVFFSQFVPGWMFNVATIVHGFEALLAVGFIFTIHFFNAHLRLEKFPVDDVMFTGRLPEEEFKHERGAEYDRAVATGEIEKLRTDPPPAWYRHIAVAAGIIAMTIGTIIVVLIILAALGIV